MASQTTPAASNAADSGQPAVAGGAQTTQFPVPEAGYPSAAGYEMPPADDYLDDGGGRPPFRAALPKLRVRRPAAPRRPRPWQPGETPPEFLEPGDGSPSDGGGPIGGLRWSTPATLARRPSRSTPAGRAVLALALVLVLVIMIAIGWLIWHAGSGNASAAHAATAPAGHKTGHKTGRQAGHKTAARPSSSPAPSSPAARHTQAAGPARALAAAGASAFGMRGPGQGDSPQLARFAIDGSLRSSWHTSWYTSPAFGNLYSGTGLMVNMGRTVTVTQVRVRLGAAPGVQYQIRVGSVPSLAALHPVARAVHGSGVVGTRLARPATGRYVLIWFTRLPADSSGTFQARIFNITVLGRP